MLRGLGLKFPSVGKLGGNKGAIAIEVAEESGVEGHWSVAGAIGSGTDLQGVGAGGPTEADAEFFGIEAWGGGGEGEGIFDFAGVAVVTSAEDELPGVGHLPFEGAAEPMSFEAALGWFAEGFAGVAAVEAEDPCPGE